MRVIYTAIKNTITALKHSSEIFLVKLIRITIYIGVFLIPVFFIPVQNEFLEFSKVVLFYGLVCLALIFWLLKIFLIKKINLHLKFLDILLFLFLIIYFLASLFSVDKYQSFFGTNLMISSSFITILFLVFFYFLVSRFITQIKELRIIFQSLNLAILIILLVNVLKIFLDNVLLFKVAINTFNFLLVLGVILSGLLVLLVKSKKVKVFNIILGLIYLITLYLIDSQYILLFLVIAIFIFILFLSFKSNYFSNKFVVLLTLLLFLTVIVLILPVSNFTGLISPGELDLPVTFGWDITKSSLSNNLLFGVGPQNFTYSFYKFKPIEFNQTSFWQLGFTQNSNFWLEILNNIGVLGILIVISIFIKYFYKQIIFIKKFKISNDLKYKKYIVVSLICVILFVFMFLGFLTDFDFILIFLFILFLGLGVSFLETEKLEKFYVNKNIINLFVYLALIFILTFVYFAMNFIAAEIIVYDTQTKIYSSLEDFKITEENLAKVNNLNFELLDYNLHLTSILTKKLVYLLNTEERLDQNVLSQISDNINITLQKQNKRIYTWQNLQANIVLLGSLGLPVADFKTKLNEKLINLDPQNPELYIDRALLNFDQYTLVKEGQKVVQEAGLVVLIEKIKTDLDTSISLKNEFVLGYYNLGLYWQEFGNEEQALINIQKAFDIDPSQKLVVLSLKKLYLNQDKVEEAKNVLNKYLELQPEDEEIKVMLEGLE